jgi:hypothetical protein
MKNTNPLEHIFNIAPGSTPTFHDSQYETATAVNERASTLIDPTNGEIVARSSVPTEMDLELEERIEDLHIDGQLESVHTNAIIAFEKSSRMSEEADPKFAARNAEVAAQYLTIALNAVNSRVDAKYKRAKSKQGKIAAGTPGTVNNNILIGDRNEILRQIFGNTEKVIENEA